MDAKLEEDVAEFWSLMFEIVIDSEKRLAFYVAQHELTPPQFFVLKTLFEHQGRCSIGQIAQAHHLTSATMTGIVKRLESMSPPLVARERSLSDKRSVEVVLTQDGHERFWAVMKELQDQARVLLGMFNSRERRELLEKIRFYFKMVVDHFPAKENRA